MNLPSAVKPKPYCPGERVDPPMLIFDSAISNPWYFWATELAYPETSTRAARVEERSLNHENP